MKTRADNPTLELLRASPERVPWPSRLEIATELEERIRSSGPNPEALALVESLASDPKHEVRNVIAHLLPLLPEAMFARIAASLGEDCHAYVRRAAQRAIAERAQASKASTKQKVGFDQISQQLRTIEDRHGASAARAARRLAERYTQLLVGSMVHDLRSILTHLRANASSLAADAEKAGAARKIGNRVKDDIDFLERTVQEMERFTEPLCGGKAPHRLLDLLQAAREQAETAVGHDKIVNTAKIRVDIRVPESITVPAVPHLLVPALTNIIKNALESFAQPPANGAPPVIAVTANVHGAWVELVIADNGMGFAPEEAAALRPFTPGRRNKTKRNSTGYGLPNAMRNIGAHGGSVQIHSQENHGTAVTIRLPVQKHGLGGLGETHEKPHGAGR